MIRFTQRNMVLIAAATALAAACSANNNNVFGSSTGMNQGGNGTGNNGTGNSGAGDVGGGINITTGSGSTSSGGQTCNHGPDEDGDADGWTANEGDCNDCDPNVNPGAIDVLVMGDGGTQMVDTDCSGAFDPPTTCDDNLALGDIDPKDGARALDLCKFAVANPSDKKQKTWGVLDAKYVRADGSAFPNPGLQVGIQPDFGPNVHVQGGKRMLVISSGYARTPSQPGACGSLSCETNLLGNPPPGFPQDNPNCPPSSDINDDVGIQLQIRTPTNATGYSFNFKFYSFEYPEWVCNDYNDQFIALVSPPPMGSINGNISFDSLHNPVSVNLGFFDVCDPSGISNFASLCFSGTCPSPPSPYCPSGTSELQGTGFDVWDDAGATSWLKSQAPVKGGSTITIRFAMWDTGDQAWDSTTVIDNFQWIANGGSVTVSTDPITTPK